MAQERVWFPGDGGPTVPDLKDRFGLASVSFDAHVPTVWRPYYLRMLGSALADLQRVLPAFAVRGLGVHFGESPMRDAALAMHDPATRTVFLPVGTSAGVIAHELAHDLDWQSARTRYGLRGTYSTDRAVRQYRDRLAASMLELSDAGSRRELVRHRGRTSRSQRSPNGGVRAKRRLVRERRSRPRRPDERLPVGGPGRRAHRVRCGCGPRGRA